MSTQDPYEPSPAAQSPSTPAVDYAKLGAEKKVVAGILGILLGGFGVHKFYLGYTKEGIIHLIATIVTCGMASILGLVEGIIYLTKSDEEFGRLYVAGRKPWF